MISIKEPVFKLYSNPLEFNDIDNNIYFGFEHESSTEVKSGIEIDFNKLKNIIERDKNISIFSVEFSIEEICKNCIGCGYYVLKYPKKQFLVNIYCKVHMLPMLSFIFSRTKKYTRFLTTKEIKDRSLIVYRRYVKPSLKQDIANDFENRLKNLNLTKDNV